MSATGEPVAPAAAPPKAPVHDTDAHDAHDAHVRTGVVYALSGFGLWGLSPAYWKLLIAVSPFEVLVHRIVWAVAFMAPMMARGGRLKTLMAAIRGPRTLLLLMVSTLLISTNWTVFIWAVANDHVLDTSLGYFMNPLVSVALGFVFLRERLNGFQTLAVACAVLGVAVMIATLGKAPLLSLLLAMTFGLYGLVRKLVPVGALEGLFVETLLCSPLALGYIAYLAMTGGNAFGSDWWITALLVFSGPFTTIPLLLFNLGARRLRLSTLGLTQYVAPSLQFALAVFAYGEPFTTAHLLTFACIWTGLAIFTADSVRRDRRFPAAG